MCGQHHSPAALPSEKRSGTHCTGGTLGPRACLEGVENLTLTGIRSHDNLALGESLYRLSYPDPQSRKYLYFINTYSVKASDNSDEENENLSRI
jgi:hypothetical protein